MHYCIPSLARVVTLALCLCISTGIQGQSPEENSSEDLLFQDLEDLQDLDTLSLIQLLDSLILTEGLNQSQLSFHLGYTSEVSNAGRTLEVKQYGFNPGITYFHKSGVFADVTGYWNSQLDPKYDLTVLSLGYIGILGKKFSYTVSYDHSFFTDTDPDFDLPPRILELLLPPILNNTVSAGLDLDLGMFESSIDYSFLFNEETAQRVQLAFNGDFKQSDVWFLDRLAFRPRFSILWGNQEIINISYSPDTFADRRFPFSVEEDKPFGVMNYQFSAPISFSKDKFQLVAEYNYNIPESLPGENFEYENNSFFSVDLYYTFGIGSKKSIFE